MKQLLSAAALTIAATAAQAQSSLYGPSSNVNPYNGATGHRGARY
jgi:hypothetical protein